MARGGHRRSEGQCGEACTRTSGFIAMGLLQRRERVDVAAHLRLLRSAGGSCGSAGALQSLCCEGSLVAGVGLLIQEKADDDKLV
jgi:hypothetical protein